MISKAKKASFYIVVLVTIALLLELSSRLVARHLLVGHIPSLCKTTKKDTLFHHVWIPLKKTLVSIRQTPYHLITNAQSWVEEYDVQASKPAGTYRIFYLGDSSVEGVVDHKYKMAELVEKGLNGRFGGENMRFEVINTGTSSYSFLQYYLLVKKKLLDYSPDLVVLNIDMTDVVNDMVYRKSVMLGSGGEIIGILPDITGKYVMTPEGYVEVKRTSQLPHWLVETSDFFYLIDMCVRHIIITRGLDYQDKRANWLQHEWSDEIRDNVDKAMETLADTIRLLKYNNIRVCLTGVPNHPQYTGEWSFKPHEVLKEVAQKERIPYLDSYRALKDKIEGTEVSRYYWPSDESHFNVDGNRIWAEAQLAFLSDPENNLLPFDDSK